MKAMVLRKVKSPLVIEQQPDLRPAADEAIITLKSAALNRRDYWITQGMYPGLKLPVTLGSDGAGVVSQIGERVDASWLGREVVINPGLKWGGRQDSQGPDFSILGFPRAGTLATEVCVPATQLHPRPEHLDWKEAAALPLAGVTAYRAIFSQGGLRADENVLVTGIGGGVALFAMQFAVAAGANVWVTSSSDEKIERAMEMGAVGGANYRSANWWEELANGAAPNLIVDSAGGDDYSQLLDIVAPGGRIISYGATAGPTEQLNLFRVFWKQLRLQGSTMGSPADFSNMLEFVNRHSIRPVVDHVFQFEEGDEAVQMMKSSPQFGKIVIDMPAG